MRSDVPGASAMRVMAANIPDVARPANFFAPLARLKKVESSFKVSQIC